MRCMPNSMNASLCLCRTRPLSHPVAACHFVCTNRPLQESVSAAKSLPYMLSVAPQLFRDGMSEPCHTWDQSVQTPSHAHTAFVRERVHQRQSDRGRFCKASIGEF
ncbi:hypothetical protein L798_12996 [Zootermopsis nevadensis]|uniref:Uncharacterized protein n=1 Tax=Zootermopsis nevadensis TaxID=136037 RepID=A0A067QT17_ZOONE|nr:hypothetical protein L798_12996 [Zootermopsis nevadensis]